MAISVLGKRSRRAFDAEESENLNALPATKKRQSRRLQTRIYEDLEEGDNVACRKNAGHSSKLPKSSLEADEITLEESCYTSTTSEAQNASSKRVGLLQSSKSLFNAPDAENVDPASPFTPTTNRFKDTLTRRIPITPSRRFRLGSNLSTPKSQHSSSTQKCQNVYSTARQSFTQASEQTRLVGRDAERKQLETFIVTAIETQRGGCTYISGPPGTGKSALVHEVLQQFTGYKHVQHSVVNCVALKSPTEALAKMADDFGLSAGKGRKSAKDSVGDLLTSKDNATNQMYLVLLDEIDNLLDGDCEILYTIFEWALHRSSSLILIGIANALDLTDRFLPRLKQRNLKPTLLPFMPYSASQISTIITQKLRSLLPATSSTAADFIPFLHPAAVQLCGKKIAAQTGDLRKAFGLVRRVIDVVEHETLLKANDQQDQLQTPSKSPLKELTNIADVFSSPSSSAKKTACISDRRSTLSHLTIETAPRANVAHMAKIAANIFNQGTLSRLRGLNLQQKAVLCSLVATEKRQQERDPYTTPSKKDKRTLSIADLYEKYAWLCKREDGILQSLKNSEFRDVVASLETLGLVHEWTGRGSSLLTPTKTPSRAGKNADEKQVVSCVSEKEMRDSLIGPGADLLFRLFD